MPPGRAPGAPGHWARSITSMSKSTMIASACSSRASACLRIAVTPCLRQSAIVQTPIPAASASRCIFAVLAKGARPIWQILAPGRPSSSKAAYGIAVDQPLVRLAQVEMGVEGDQPDLVQRRPEPVRGGPGDRIVAAEQQGEIVIARCSAGPAPGSARSRRPAARRRRRHRRRRAERDRARRRSRRRRC